MFLCLKFILNSNVKTLSGVWFLSVGLVLKVVFIYLFIIKTNVLVILYYRGGVFLF